MAHFALPDWLPPLPWTLETDPRHSRHPLPSPQQLAQQAERELAAARGEAIGTSLADRWFVLGQTGSGKTQFAKRLVRQLRALYPAAGVYVADSKGGDDFTRWPGLVTEQDPPGPVGPGGIQVWQPPADDVDAYDEWLHSILKARRPALVFIDELSSIGGKTGNSFPLGFAKLLKQGRSLGVAAVVCSQEAAYIPRQVHGQATHLVCFRLEDDIDKQRAAKWLRLEGGWRDPAGRYGFHYRRNDPPGTPHEYERHQEFF